VHRHGPEELCEAGLELYERALREGQVSGADADAAPCLVDFGLLHPCVTDLGRLEPVSPAAALHRLLRASADRIAGERRREEQLVETFGPLMSAGGRPAAAMDLPGIEVVSGLDRINEAIAGAMADASRELLAIQPYDGHNPAERLAKSLSHDQDRSTAGAVSARSTSTHSGTRPPWWRATSSSPATPRRAPSTRSPSASS
jgi:hypothetical protein